ncbi:dentin sialophosphoprotein-like isoform X1 [Ambystoma mexicanum]|uniref:dentin sialophosphoprotein-like isoform X1 n=1 Tax=Ambystoma mexicanum TaxID=8296 RepID=UPI0037E7148C
MSALIRSLLLSCAVAVVLAIVAADEVTASTVDPSPASARSTREPEEPEQTEAPEQTDATTLAENALHGATTQDLSFSDSLPISFGGADRALTEKMNPGGSSHGDASDSDSSNSESQNSESQNSESQNSESFNVDPTNAELLSLNEETPAGPAGETPAESVESQENVDLDVDSEEAFTLPGALAALK